MMVSSILFLVLVAVFVSTVESRLGNQQKITPPMGVSPQMMGQMGGYGMGTFAIEICFDGARTFFIMCLSFQILSRLFFLIFMNTFELSNLASNAIQTNTHNMPNSQVRDR